MKKILPCHVCCKSGQYFTKAHRHPNRLVNTEKLKVTACHRILLPG